MQGLCNIRLTALSKGSGVDTAEQVNAGQITGYRVVFSAEQKRGAANKGYALNLGNLKWRPLPGSAAEESNNGSGDNNQEPAETANVTITATANDATMGSVTGGGSYVQGASVTLTATANEGYHFVSWSNGRTTASITITAESDTTLTATFAADDTGGTGGDNGMDG